MIHAIDLLFCTICAFLFKHFFTFIIFIVLGFLILRFIIQKLSNITILLYLLFVITMFAGGVVLWLLPDKEDIFSDEVINSYYLGTLAFILLIALLISIGYDLYKIINSKKKKKKPLKVETKQEEKKIKHIENNKKESLVKEKEIKEEKIVKKTQKKKTTKKPVKKTKKSN